MRLETWAAWSMAGSMGAGMTSAREVARLPTDWLFIALLTGVTLSPRSCSACSTSELSLRSTCVRAF